MNAPYFPALDDATLSRLARRGSKVDCPWCDKRVMSQFDMPLHHSGIGQHVRDAHPEGYQLIVDASNREEFRLKAEAREKAAEERERPQRKHVVTGAFLMEVVEEIDSLIGMMEPYYSQCDGSREAEALIKRIEDIIASKPEQVLA